MYKIEHEGPRNFVLYRIDGPGEKVKLDTFKTNHTAKKELAKLEEADGFKKLVENVPERIRFLGNKTAKAWQRAMTSNSRKFAIRAFCLECCGGDNSAVAGCTAKECPLWQFRIKG